MRLVDTPEHLHLGLHHLIVKMHTLSVTYLIKTPPLDVRHKCEEASPPPPATL